MAKKSSKEEFIQKSLKVHGNVWNYDEVEYHNALTEVAIKCTNHGMFLQTPMAHVQGKGCPKCGNIKTGNSSRLSTEEFVKRFIEIHGDSLDCSKVIYKNNRTKVPIYCPEHGEFWAIPKSLLIFKTGCPKCCGMNKTTEEFIREVKEVHEEDRYDLNEVDYKNSKTLVIVNCREHGRFQITPKSLLAGRGCKECGKIKSINFNKSNKEEFVEKAKIVHGEETWLYDEVDYKNDKTKVAIKCREHGTFWQRPHGHLQGSGCPHCSGYISISETKWLNSIEEKEGLTLVRQYDIPVGNYLFKVDGYCKETNTVYEFNGDYWHGNPEVFDSCDVNVQAGKTHGELYQKTIWKEGMLKEAGYNIISIWESDYNDQKK